MPTADNGEKLVIVTGGSRGLGFATVAGLLQAGYAVATCSRSITPELQAMLADQRYRGRLMWHAVAIDDPEAIERYVAGLFARPVGASPYGLVNNAGVAVEGILATLPVVEISRVLATNLVGAMTAARAFLRHMLKTRRPGRIINVSSIIGSRGYTGLSAYSASKGGLDAFTRSLAREVGRRGITVNSIAPGYLDTEMSASLGARQREQVVNRTPLGRLGRVSDVVPLILFVLSAGAEFITGQTLTVDGGITC